MPSKFDEKFNLEVLKVKLNHDKIKVIEQHHVRHKILFQFAQIDAKS